ncbi:MAG: hypothetical protein HYW48_11305 [Deltaproteobacteria bacterium]|nr:hypothetical protein [Deltaproteobacteria bacterium]
MDSQGNGEFLTIGEVWWYFNRLKWILLVLILLSTILSWVAHKNTNRLKTSIQFSKAKTLPSTLAKAKDINEVIFDLFNQPSRSLEFIKVFFEDLGSADASVKQSLYNMLGGLVDDNKDPLSIVSRGIQIDFEEYSRTGPEINYARNFSFLFYAVDVGNKFKLEYITRDANTVSVVAPALCRSLNRMLESYNRRIVSSEDYLNEYTFKVLEKRYMESKTANDEALSAFRGRKIQNMLDYYRIKRQILELSPLKIDGLQSKYDMQHNNIQKDIDIRMGRIVDVSKELSEAGLLFEQIQFLRNRQILTPKTEKDLIDSVSRILAEDNRADREFSLANVKFDEIFKKYTEALSQSQLPRGGNVRAIPLLDEVDFDPGSIIQNADYINESTSDLRKFLLGGFAAGFALFVFLCFFLNILGKTRRNE